MTAAEPVPLVQGGPDKQFKNLRNSVKKENGSLLGISRYDRILYIPVVILIAVAFLTLITQTQIPSDILLFDNPQDGIAAFLLGFASQSAAVTLFGWLRSE